MSIFLLKIQSFTYLPQRLSPVNPGMFQFILA